MREYLSVMLLLQWTKKLWPFVQKEKKNHRDEEKNFPYKWMYDLTFTVDMPTHSQHFALKCEIICEQIKLWQVQLQRVNTVHFPSLWEQKPVMTSECTAENAKLLQAVAVSGHEK